MVKVRIVKAGICLYEVERKELNAMMVEELKNSIAFYEQRSK